MLLIYKADFAEITEYPLHCIVIIKGIKHLQTFCNSLNITIKQLILFGGFNHLLIDIYMFVGSKFYYQ